jgi:hypothetical protein
MTWTYQLLGYIRNILGVPPKQNVKFGQFRKFHSYLSYSNVNPMHPILELSFINTHHLAVLTFHENPDSSGNLILKMKNSADILLSAA